MTSDKTVNAFTSSIDKVVEDYYAQLQHYIEVLGAPYGYITVLIGTMRHEWKQVDRDEIYITDLVERERRFWHCVETRTPPEGFGATASPKAPGPKFKSMAGNNEWADSAAKFLEKKAAATEFESAKKQLKQIMPDDVTLAIGHGVTASRSKSGSLTVRKTNKKDDEIATLSSQ
jgi:predicted phage-related endonuclease